jgi:hypothetical protein
MALDTDPDRHSDLDEFEENYEEILDELTSNNIRVVTANLVDVTQIAYLIPPPSENLGIPDTHRVALTVLLDILQGKSPSLTADDILTPAEMKQIRTTVEKFNGVIERLCKEHDVPVFDAWSFMDDAYKNGYDVGSTTLTTEMFGGIFSLDGIHPTYTAQAVIANGFIEILNGKFGQGVVDIDVESVLANDPNKPTDAAPAALLDARSARALEESIKNLREILLKR